MTFRLPSWETGVTLLLSLTAALAAAAAPGAASPPHAAKANKPGSVKGAPVQPSSTSSATAAPAKAPEDPPKPLPMAVFPLPEVQGLRIGMTPAEAAAALKAKGLALRPDNHWSSLEQGSLEAARNLMNPAIGDRYALDNPNRPMTGGALAFTQTTDPPRARSIEYAQGGTRLLRKAVLDQLHAKYGPPTSESETHVWITGAMLDRAHTQLLWYFDERGHVLSQAVRDQLCPTLPDTCASAPQTLPAGACKPPPPCKVVSVVADVSFADHDQIVHGFSVHVEAPWLIKLDQDEKERRKNQADKKAHDEKVDQVRQNRPQSF